MNLDMYSQWLDAQQAWLKQAPMNHLGDQANQWSKSYEQWLESQKKSWNLWQDASKNSNWAQAGQAFANPFMNVNFPGYTEWQAAQEEGMKAWKQLNQQNPWSQYLQGLPDVNTIMQQVANLNPMPNMTNFVDSDMMNAWKKVMSARNIYQYFFKFYEQINKQLIQPGTKEAKQALENWLSQQQNYYQILVEPFIPQTVRSFVQGPQAILDNLTGHLGSFWAPWQGNWEELSQLYALAASGDTAKLSEFYDLWQENYNQTFGAYSQSPIFGNNAEIFESQNKFMDTLIRLLVVSSEFSSKINQITQTHVEAKMKDYLALVEKNEQPKTYKEFYEYWSNSIEKTLNTYFYTDEFSQLLGEFSELYANVKLRQDDLMTRYFANTPFVMEPDMKSLYKKVYDLKKDVRELKKELKALKSQSKDEETPKPAARARKSSN